MTQGSLKDLIASNLPDLAQYESLYKHFHAQPELSLQEKETAATIARHLYDLKVYQIHENIGGHGLAAILENGHGKTVLLRADMDALPVEEKTGLPYASKKTMTDVADNENKPVMHACGHDMHITCLLAAAEALVNMKDSWHGTLIVLFQPNEERAGGAKAMVEDGLYQKIPKPDIVLGQHVIPNRSGTLGSRPGTIMAAADSFRMKLYGRGGHASMPQRTIDPVIMAANVVSRLQTIVSREVDPSDMAVLTVGSLQAGQTENIIADSAELRVNVRTITPETRDKVLSSIRRIVKAECEASGSPHEPLIEITTSFPSTWNDPELTKAVAEAFSSHFGDDFDDDTPRMNASEDFSFLGTSIGKPCCFWFFGGTEHEKWDEAKKDGTLEALPGNHSAYFAPAVQPTMTVGVNALLVAAMTFLAS